MKKLQDRSISSRDHHTINDIDDTFTKAQMKAEKAVSAKQNMEFPWSPKLAQAYLHLQIWLAAKHQVEKGADRTIRLSKLYEKLTTPTPDINVGLCEIKKNVSQAKRDLQEVKKMRHITGNRN